MNFDTFIVANRISVKINNRMANSVDPDEMAWYKPSHLDLQFAKVLVCRDDRVK